MQTAPFILLIPGFHNGLGNLAMYLLFSGYLSAFIFLKNREVFYSRGTWNQLSFFITALLLMLLSLAINAGVSGLDYMNSRASYLIRLTASYSTFYMAYQLFKHYGFSLNFRRNLIYVFLIGAAIEFSAMLTHVPFVIDLFKAREDIGGIDTLHYNRFSGLFSYPGDVGFAAIALSPFVFISNFNATQRIAILSVLIITLGLSQSRLAFGLLMASVALYALMNPAFFMTWRRGALLILGMVAGSYYFATMESLFTVKLSYVNSLFTNLDYYLWESKRATEWINLSDATLPELLFGLHSNNIELFYESEWAGSIARNGLIGSAWLFILGGVTTACLIRAKRLRNDTVLWLCCILFCYIWIYCLFSAGISRWKIGVLFQVLLAWACCVTGPRYRSKNG